MASAMYNSGKRDLWNGSVNLAGDTIKALLVTSTYTLDVDAHTKRSDITNEVTGTGYTAGGAALASKTVTADNTNDKAVFDADDTTWTAATITARAVIYYKSRGGAASADELIAYVDFGVDKTASGGDFVIQQNASGILRY